MIRRIAWDEASRLVPAAEPRDVNVGSVEFASGIDHQVGPTRIVAEFDVMAVETNFDDHTVELGNDLAPTAVAQTTMGRGPFHERSVTRVR